MYVLYLAVSNPMLYSAREDTTQARTAPSRSTVRSTLSPKESDHHCVGRTCGPDLARDTTNYTLHAARTYDIVDTVTLITVDVDRTAVVKRRMSRKSHM